MRKIQPQVIRRPLPRHLYRQLQPRPILLQQLVERAQQQTLPSRRHLRRRRLRPHLPMKLIRASHELHLPIHRQLRPRHLAIQLAQSSTASACENLPLTDDPTTSASFAFATFGLPFARMLIESICSCIFASFNIAPESQTSQQIASSSTRSPAPAEATKCAFLSSAPHQRRVSLHRQRHHVLSRPCFITTCKSILCPFPAPDESPPPTPLPPTDPPAPSPHPAAYLPSSHPPLALKLRM